MSEFVTGLTVFNESDRVVAPSDNDAPFSYEAALLRNALLPAERDAVVARLAAGDDLKAAAEQLGLPLDVTLRAVGDPAAVAEIAALAMDAMRVQFIVTGLNELMAIVKTTIDPKAKIEAMKLLADILAMRAETSKGMTAAQKKKQLPKGVNVSSLERAVRDAVAPS